MLYVYLALELTENTGSLPLALHINVNPLCSLVKIIDTAQVLLIVCANTCSLSLIFMTDRVVMGLVSAVHSKVTSLPSSTIAPVGKLLVKSTSVAASIIIYTDSLYERFQCLVSFSTIQK